MNEFRELLYVIRRNRGDEQFIHWLLVRALVLEKVLYEKRHTI